METRSQQEKIRAGSADDAAPMWLQRASLTVMVVTCIYLGLLVALLPWTRYWRENRLLDILPLRAATLLETGWARGVISGLGLIDIWIGISELVQWRGRRTAVPAGLQNGAPKV